MDKWLFDRLASGTIAKKVDVRDDDRRLYYVPDPLCFFCHRAVDLLDFKQDVVIMKDKETGKFLSWIHGDCAIKRGILLR